MLFGGWLGANSYPNASNQGDITLQMLMQMNEKLKRSLEWPHNRYSGPLMF
jgi:hypothetical protein